MTPGLTSQDLQDDFVDWLQKLFDGKAYKAPGGGTKQIKFYPGDLPITKTTDDDDGPDGVLTPYGIVRLMDGKVETWEGPQTETVVLVFCVYDDDLNRSGARDILGIKEKVLTELRERPYIGGVFETVPPIEWAVSDEDTHPYYYGAMSFTVNCPVAQKEASDLA